MSITHVVAELVRQSAPGEARRVGDAERVVEASSGHHVGDAAVVCVLGDERGGVGSVLVAHCVHVRVLGEVGKGRAHPARAALDEIRHLAQVEDVQLEAHPACGVGGVGLCYGREDFGLRARLAVALAREGGVEENDVHFTRGVGAVGQGLAAEALQAAAHGYIAVGGDDAVLGRVDVIAVGRGVLREEGLVDLEDLIGVVVRGGLDFVDGAICHGDESRHLALVLGEHDLAEIVAIDVALPRYSACVEY
mmetsp:Transcript_24822/g.78499  ORF Transcript_24822/g.78499 Transcript_24822/m.78499 type:complete len:250 (-) Transcript_24822:578-1327(-)